MSKKEFLKRLNRALSTLPRDEREKTIAYYDELIEDRKEAGSTEEAAVAAMGDVRTIADDIIADAKERGVEIKRRGMPTAVKALIVVLSVVIGLAVIGSGAFAVLGLVNAANAGEWEKTENYFELDEKRLVEIDLTNLNAEILPSGDDKIHFSYYMNEDLVVYSFDETDERITFRQRQKNPMFWFVPNTDKYPVVVLIPEGFTGSIVSIITTGDMSFSDIRSAETIELKATTGDISVVNAAAKNAVITVTTGDVNVYRCDFSSSLGLSGTTGDVIIKNTELGFLSVSVTTGEIELENIVCGDMDIGTTTGSAKISSVRAKKANIHASTGSISLFDLDAEDITLKTTTGSITGTLVGSITDYTVESHVSTGKNNLPEAFGNGPRKLNARASTGDIRIGFSED